MVIYLVSLNMVGYVSTKNMRKNYKLCCVSRYLSNVFDTQLGPGLSRASSLVNQLISHDWPVIYPMQQFANMAHWHIAPAVFAVSRCRLCHGQNMVEFPIKKGDGHQARGFWLGVWDCSLDIWGFP